MITIIVLTKNEQKNIKECLNSAKWADELIVVDDYSEDKTLEIAKEYTKKIYQRKLGLDFSSQRNFAISKATKEWVMFLDADERISEELKNEMIGKLNFSNQYDGYEIKRLDVMWKKKILHGEQGNIKLLRLFKKDKGKSLGKVHEEIKVKGKIGQLNNSIAHYPHQVVAEFLRELNLYSSIRAMALYDKGVKTNWFLILCYTKGKFIKNYFFLRGFLDGIQGLVLAILMSMHSFLTRSKLWLLCRKK